MSDNPTHAVEGLFREVDGAAHLLGSRCASCKTPYFPKSLLCHNANCDDSKMEDAEYGPSGTLWSYSVQNYPPPPPAITPDPYEPYAVGVVDLDDGLRVAGRMTTTDPDRVKVGARVKVVLGPLGRDDEGTELVSWLFDPV